MPNPTIKVPVKFIPDPTIGNALLDVSSLDPAGATDGQVVQRIAGVWAPGPAPTVAPVVADVTTAGVQAAPARAAWNLALVHTTAGTGAVTLPFPVTPQDQDRFEWMRTASGDCPITLTSAKQIEFENQSSTSIGPMGPEYPGGWATYFAADDVWRI